MRNLILVAVASLAIGSLSALAYSHFLGDGHQVAQVQSELDSANSSLAKNTQDAQQLKSETDAMTAQIQELSAKNDELKHQVVELKKAANSNASTAPAANPMANMIKAQMSHMQAQKLLLLESRLHLTPEQETAVKAAMDAEAQRGEAMASKMFQGGKIDPQAMADLQGAKSLEQTLNDILTPDQQTAYQQMKTDEKNSNLETMASVEMNQLTPLLQLTDAQKDQVYTALYQSQANLQDPAWIKNNMNSTDPMAIITAQAKVKEDALAKVLTPDQLSAYHQQAQSQLEMQKSMMQKYMAPNSAAPVPATTSSATPAP